MADANENSEVKQSITRERERDQLYLQFKFLTEPSDNKSKIPVKDFGFILAVP